MPFSIAGYLVGRVVGERQGITDDAVLNRLSLMGALMGTTPTGVIMTTVLAQREAEDIAPPTTNATPTAQVEVPDVTELSFNDASRRLESLGLIAARRDLYSITTPKDTIIHQNPEPKTVVSQGATITLSVSLGAELPAPGPPKTESTESTHGVDSKKTAHAAARRG